MRSVAGIGSAVLMISGLWGCGGPATDGPARHSLSGQVLFRGKPVPKGSIHLSPDTEKGNQGPGVVIPIKNGRYQTQSDLGSVGGPMIVKITGLDGVPYTEGGETITDGRPLFPLYQAEVELPKKSEVFDFEVPATTSSR